MHLAIDSGFELGAWRLGVRATDHRRLVRGVAHVDGREEDPAEVDREEQHDDEDREHEGRLHEGLATAVALQAASKEHWPDHMDGTLQVTLREPPDLPSTFVLVGGRFRGL